MNSPGEKTLPAADTLALGDKLTIVVEALADGKMRVTSLAWEDARVLLPNQVLELRTMGKRVRVVKKERHPDAGDLPMVAAVGCYDFVDDTAAEPTALELGAAARAAGPSGY